MVASGMRAGVCPISHRYAKAINPYLGADYDPHSPSKYIIYLEDNNLYGWAMSHYLITGHFYWVDEAGWTQINCQATSPTDPFAYIVECELEYPTELQDLHNDYPLAAERVQIQVEMLSLTEVEISRHYARARMGKNVKLVTNLMKKTKSVVHSANLKFHLDHGLPLTKIHRVIGFKQCRWMAPYIGMYMAMRAAAQNEMERDFHYLKNNAV